MGRFTQAIKPHQRFVVTAVVVVMAPVVVVAAAPLCFFELLAALVGLFASLAVALERVAELIFGLMNTSFTCFVSVASIVRTHREGRSQQADDRRQYNAKNSKHSGHDFSL